MQDLWHVTRLLRWILPVLIIHSLEENLSILCIMCRANVRYLYGGIIAIYA